MNEQEQNTQRIMTELLAAHAQTKRMLAENFELMERGAELDKLVGQQRLHIDALELDNDRLRAEVEELEAASYAFLEYVDYNPDPEDDSEEVGDTLHAMWDDAERKAREALEEK